MATSIFTSQLPAITNGDDGTDYTLGTAFRRSTSGSITHGRWYFPDPVPAGTTQFVLYNVGTQAELSRASFVSPVAGAWNTVELPAPVAYTADTLLVAAIYTSARYVATTNFFTADLVNDDITAPGDTNGRLGNTDEYPSIVSGNDSSFFADIVFAEAASSVAPSGVPVAVGLGTPSVSQAFAAVPAGIAVPVELGAPAAAQVLAVTPVGQPVPVALGTPTATLAGVAPTGVGVPVAVGSPAVAWSATVAPTGVAIAVGLGAPRLPGGIVTRPNTGTITRPNTGIITRP